MTRGVPCHERVADVQHGVLEEDEEEQGEWLAPSLAGAARDVGTGGDRAGAKAGGEDGYADVVLTGPEQHGIEGVQEEASIGVGIDLSKALMDDYVDEQGDVAGGAAPRRRDTGTVAEEEGSGDEYADLAEFEDEQIELDETTLTGTDAGVGGAAAGGYLLAADPDGEQTFVKPRTYDVSISYDKYYSTPRIWLFGYNEDGQPLAPEETFEDVVEDYRDRTVTIDPHPHSGVSHASIHPCQHGATMKRLVDAMVSGGVQPRPEQYMLIFLKFIQSVVPTIHYDYTGTSVILGDAA